MQDNTIERISNTKFDKLSKDDAKFAIDWSWKVNIHGKTFGGTVATEDGVEGFKDATGEFHPQGEQWFGRIDFEPPTTTEQAIADLGEAVALDLLVAGITSRAQNTGEFIEGAVGRQGHQREMLYMGQSKTAIAKAKNAERLDKGAHRIATKMGISQDEAMDMILGLGEYEEE